MRKSEAEEILTKMKQNYLNLDDLQKANALQFALNCLNDTDKDLTLIYLKGVADTKSAWINRLKEELDKQIDIVNIGDGGHSKIKLRKDIRKKRISRRIIKWRKINEI